MYSVPNLGTISAPNLSWCTVRACAQSCLCVAAHERTSYGNLSVYQDLIKRCPHVMHDMYISVYRYTWQTLACCACLASYTSPR